MKVSIIMCSYNASAYIDEAICSILSQTYKNWELIISDDCSTDDTTRKIARYLADDRIKLISNEVNLGYVKNKNAVFPLATGELITQLDCDDTCPADRIEKQVNVFLKHPEIMMVGSNYSTIDMDGNTLETFNYEKDFLIEEPCRPYPFWFPVLMFRKEVVEEFGLFSEYFNNIYGDDNYWTYLVNSKYPIYFIKDALYLYRINPASITNFYDHPRKLIVEEILQELFNQRRETGTDWLETGAYERMMLFEAKLFNDYKLIAEKYRVWAAKAIDKRDWRQASLLLRKAMQYNMINLTLYKTLSYYIRTRFLKGRMNLVLTTKALLLSNLLSVSSDFAAIFNDLVAASGDLVTAF